MKRRSLSLLLALTIIISLLPIQAAAEAEKITVTVSIENLTQSTAPWTVSLLGDAPMSIELPDESSTLDAVKQALSNAELSLLESSGFISSIAGLQNGDYTAGDYSGWIGSVNGGVPNVGLDYVKLKNGDTVRMVYSDSVGSVSAYGLNWSDSNASSSGFAFSTGILSCVEESYSTSLYLTVPSGTEMLQVAAIPDEDYTSVTIYPYDAASYAPVDSVVYGLNEEITLDGSFNALLIVVDEWSADYTIDLRRPSSVDIAKLKETASDEINGELDYWSVLPIYSIGKSYSADQKQVYIDDAIARLADLGVGALSLQCLALNAMGYDPAQITDAFGISINAYNLLAAKDFSSATDSDKAYAVMSLLHAGDMYSDKIVSIVAALAANQQENGTWPDPWGYGYETDVTSAALTALAMADSGGSYSSTISKAASALIALRNTDGTFPGASGGSGNANSTAMAIIALASVGLYQEGEGNADGLLMFATGDDTGFIYSDSWGNSYNELATQQSLLALSAVEKHDTPTPFFVFDFTSEEKEPASATPVTGAVITFNVSPADALVTVAGQTPRPTGYYDLSAGSYEYSVSKSGYVTKTGSITVTEEQAEAHDAVAVAIALNGISSDEESNFIYIKVAANDKILYNRKKMALSSDMTPLSALLNTGLDVEYKANGYVTNIEKYEEFGNGSNSGWLYMVNGDEGILNSAGSYKLSANDELVWFYTTDYTQETGSSSWTGSSGIDTSVNKNVDGSFTVKVTSNGSSTYVAGGVVVELEAGRDKVPAIVTENGFDIIEVSAFADGMMRFVLHEGATVVLLDPSVNFADVEDGSWYIDDLTFACARRLVLGISGSMFAPNAQATREMAVTALYRLQDSPQSDGTVFADVPSDSWFAESVAWAHSAGVVRGNGTVFGAGEELARQELAVLLYRYASVLGLDTTPGKALELYRDATETADWASDALSWAANNSLMQGSGDFLLNPNGTVTRADLVAALHRLTQLMLE